MSCFMCFLDGGYVYLVPGEIIDDISSHLLFSHRVRVEDGNAHGSYPIFHFD